MKKNNNEEIKKQFQKFCYIGLVVQYMSSIRHIGPMMALLALCGAAEDTNKQKQKTQQQAQNK